MRTKTHLARRSARPLALAIACAVIALPASPALAGSGGIGPDGGGGGGGGVSGKNAKLHDGLAKAPRSAPTRVKKVIAAANDIAKGKGYCMGGGHGSWHDNCYDCSGSISYALHGGDFVNSPMPSGSYMHWGRSHKGKWITVYANEGHMYAIIAGLRFDTSMTPGEGPGWSKNMRDNGGFRERHPRHF